MKNYNIAYQLDGDTTDDDLVRMFHLDPRVAGTPKINGAVRQATRERNIADSMRGGLSRETAVANADKLYKDSVELENKLKKFT